MDNKVVTTLITDLGLVFRHILPGIIHILPGIIVMAALHERYFHRFCWLKLDQTSHLVILGVIALAAGSVAMSLNRYIFMQLVDLTGWRWSIKGKAYPGGGAYAILSSFCRLRGEPFLWEGR